MRRRHEGTEPPADLLVFHGRDYRTEPEWMDAFEQWHAERARWLAVRGLPADGLPPQVVDGDCPFDPALI